MEGLEQARHWVHFLPVVTTTLSVLFCIVLLRRHRMKGKGTHLLWWAAGVFFYGLGTGFESAITLFGNSVTLTKCWYVAGAILGGYPLAQGTVYLLLRQRTARLLTAWSLPYVAAASVLVFMSPVNVEAMQAYRPSGAILGWQWVRLLTPLINGYAALFLIGGAVLSAWRFAKKTSTLHRAVGNTLIAVGALLPGVGGGLAKGGLIEALYIGELLGLILIWAGYRQCVRIVGGVTLPVESRTGALEPVLMADPEAESPELVTSS